MTFKVPTKATYDIALIKSGKKQQERTSKSKQDGKGYSHEGLIYSKEFPSEAIAIGIDASRRCVFCSCLRSACLLWLAMFGRWSRAATPDQPGRGGPRGSDRRTAAGTAAAPAHERSVRRRHERRCPAARGCRRCGARSDTCPMRTAPAGCVTPSSPACGTEYTCRWSGGSLAAQRQDRRSGATLTFGVVASRWRSGPGLRRREKPAEGVGRLLDELPATTRSGLKSSSTSPRSSTVPNTILVPHEVSIAPGGADLLGGVDAEDLLHVRGDLGVERRQDRCWFRSTSDSS